MIYVYASLVVVAIVTIVAFGYIDEYLRESGAGTMHRVVLALLLAVSFISGAVLGYLYFIHKIKDLIYIHI